VCFILPFDFEVFWSSHTHQRSVLSFKFILFYSFSNFIFNWSICFCFYYFIFILIFRPCNPYSFFACTCRFTLPLHLIFWASAFKRLVFILSYFILFYLVLVWFVLFYFIYLFVYLNLFSFVFYSNLFLTFLSFFYFILFYFIMLWKALLLFLSWWWTCGSKRRNELASEENLVQFSLCKMAVIVAFKSLTSWVTSKNCLGKACTHSSIARDVHRLSSQYCSCVSSKHQPYSVKMKVRLLQVFQFLNVFANY
jgi:hypothetical protein